MQKPPSLILILILVLLINIEIQAQQLSGSRNVNFYKEWKFIQQDVSNAQDPSLNDDNWRTLNLPHDWSIEGKFSQNEPSGDASGYLPTGIGWYRKSFTSNGDLSNKKVFIHFEGVYHRSKVYINGKLLGERFYGYSPLIYDLTPHLNSTGENVLAVRVDNSDQINSRWYTGSGIYRDVWLIITDKLYVDIFGITITTPKAAKSADIRVRTRVKNEYGITQPVKIETALKTKTGTLLACDTSAQEIGAGKTVEFTQNFSGVSVSLWSPESPVMYTAASRVICDEKVKDSLESPFGVRKIEFNKDRGFLLNDNVVKMKGVNIHHDLGCIGTAYYERAMRRRLMIFKDMGINAIRTSHNPHASNLLDLCDSMGFLVINEAFDKFASPYYPDFSRGWKKDLQDFIDRDVNHPCVIQWSVGNEVADNDGAILKELVDFVHSYEPTRRVSFSWSPHTLNSYFGGSAALKSQIPSMDVLNINYSEHLLEKVRSSIPDKAMVMTEAFVYYRGNGTTIKAFYEQNPWLDVLKYDYLAGSFIWSGIDYLGEAISKWPMHGWNGSPVDATGYMKPVAYLHKSFSSKEPFVRIAVRHKDFKVPPATKEHWDLPTLLDHWTLPDFQGKVVRVYTFTNQPEVELTLNGVSKGKKKLIDFKDKMMYWDISYEPGIIRADCGSAAEPLASHELHTAGPAAAIKLTPDTNTIIANGKDICHMEVRITDIDGNLVPSANNSITFDVSGSGTLLALDNGNLQSTESHQQTSKRDAFCGRALAVIKSSMTPGTITLCASAQGLTSGQIVINTIEGNQTGTTDITGIPNLIPKAYEWIRISPHGKCFRITLPDNVHHNVHIIKANGSCIKKFSSNTSATHIWNTGSTGQGVYYIYAQSGRHRYTRKVLVYQ
jgi:beta-galactosidase